MSYLSQPSSWVVLSAVRLDAESVSDGPDDEESRHPRDAFDHNLSDGDGVDDGVHGHHGSLRHGLGGQAGQGGARPVDQDAVDQPPEEGEEGVASAWKKIYRIYFPLFSLQSCSRVKYSGHSGT